MRDVNMWDVNIQTVNLWQLGWEIISRLTFQFSLQNHLLDRVITSHYSDR
jgi:hypothetical protein